jgi:hypothetical protein
LDPAARIIADIGLQNYTQSLPRDPQRGTLNEEGGVGRFGAFPSPAVLSAMVRVASPPRREENRIQGRAKETVTMQGGATIIEDLPKSVRDLGSNDLTLFIDALNVVSRYSYGPLDGESEGLLLENHPTLLTKLIDILELFNPVGANYTAEYKSYADSILECSKPWSLQLPKIDREWDINIQCLDENQFFLSTLNILRNLSFEIGNEAYIANSLPMIRNLSSIIAFSTSPGRPMMDATRYALDIVSNIGRHIDISGRRRAGTSAYMQMPSGKGAGKSELKRTIQHLCSEHMDLAKAEEYTAVATLLFPLMYEYLKSPDRKDLLSACDIITKLASCPENAPFLTRAPDEFLLAIHQLLFVTSTNVDVALPVYDQDRELRLPACSAPRLFHELVDAELRDAAAETLYTLSTLSQRLRERLLDLPDLVPTLLRLIEDKNFNKTGSDVHSKLANLLILMAQASDNSQFGAIAMQLGVNCCSDDFSVDIAGASKLFEANTYDHMIVDEPV